LTFAMTREIRVAPAVLAAARASLPDERELVELIGVIASYNMVSRFLVATGVTMAGEETP
jgi:alkylhydroperoxidase family enzyme